MEAFHSVRQILGKPLRPFLNRALGNGGSIVLMKKRDVTPFALLRHPLRQKTSCLVYAHSRFSIAFAKSIGSEFWKLKAWGVTYAFKIRFLL